MPSNYNKDNDTGYTAIHRIILEAGCGENPYLSLVPRLISGKEFLCDELYW